MNDQKKNNGNIIIIFSILMVLCICFCVFLGIVVLGKRGGNEPCNECCQSGKCGQCPSCEETACPEQGNVSAGETAAVQEPAQVKETSTQYVLYIGTNDKDTYKQEIPTEEAIAIVDRICLAYLEGYTLQSAEGRWLDETHTVTVEQTIVCYIDGSDAETVYKICDEVLTALNQNTILVETNEVTMDYYGGK